MREHLQAFGGRGEEGRRGQWRSSNSDVIVTRRSSSPQGFKRSSTTPRSSTTNSKPLYAGIMSTTQDSGRSYHLECTGEAQETAKAHSRPENITLFGSCFCPFVQRVWVTLEHFGFDYKVRTRLSLVMRMLNSAYIAVL